MDFEIMIRLSNNLHQFPPPGLPGLGVSGQLKVSPRPVMMSPCRELSSNQRAALRQWTNERPECWASMSPQEASSPHIALPTEITLRIYTNYTNWSNENILNVTSCITGRCEPIENVYFISFLCRFYIFHRWILFVWTDSLREDLINLGLIIIYKTCN